tara:strand:+ start:2438 stop:2587 length:150 start_codon:yes stop_codon:yes gene_type:complete
MKTMFEAFKLNGIEYYYHKGKCFVDNGTIRQELTIKEYENAMMDYLIKG